MESGCRTVEPTITVRNLQRTVPVNVPALTEFAKSALRDCARIRARRPFPSGEVAVLLVSDRRIDDLHRQFMNVAGPTDVITFQHGEIFISVQAARRHARRFQTSFARELQLYIVHGLLHLRGFDDKEPADERRMRAQEAKILRSAGTVRNETRGV
jgi:probable rRNA maturation factor